MSSSHWNLGARTPASSLESINLTLISGNKLPSKPGVYDRAAKSFMDDAKPKFILSTSGEILAANMAAQNLLLKDVLSSDHQNILNYGLRKQTALALRIIDRLASGRQSCERMLGKMPDDEWCSYEFVRIGNYGKVEIALTINERTSCPESALNAISHAFALTVTETEVVKHISEALSPKEIAYEMDISTHTVRAHLRSIYSKTGVRGYNGTLRLVMQLMN